MNAFTLFKLLIILLRGFFCLLSSSSPFTVAFAHTLLFLMCYFCFITIYCCSFVRVNEFLWYIRLFLPNFIHIYLLSRALNCCVWHVRQYYCCVYTLSVCDFIAPTLWVNVPMMLLRANRYVLLENRKFLHTLNGKGKNNNIKRWDISHIQLTIHSFEHIILFFLSSFSVHTCNTFGSLLSFIHLILCMHVSVCTIY